MTIKRAAMLGFSMLLIAVPSLAQDASRLSHQKVELLAPPFVHPHQQATTEDPKIIEFRLVVQERRRLSSTTSVRPYRR
jgi:nitrite reductase (NO-forming)